MKNFDEEKCDAMGDIFDKVDGFFVDAICFFFDIDADSIGRWLVGVLKTIGIIVALGLFFSGLVLCANTEFFGLGAYSFAIDDPRGLVVALILIIVSILGIILGIAALISMLRLIPHIFYVFIICPAFWIKATAKYESKSKAFAIGFPVYILSMVVGLAFLSVFIAVPVIALSPLVISLLPWLFWMFIIALSGGGITTIIIIFIVC